MRNRRRVGLILFAALLGFSCTPVFSSSLVPTLDPLSLQTAIARTAEAASAQTAVAPSGAKPILSGPTLDAGSLNTMIAQTAGSAATQTAGLLPPRLTPSVTPLPTWTPTITPLPTNTFFIKLPPTATKPAPINTINSGGGPTATSRGGGGPPDPVSIYSCRVLRVSPKDRSILAPNQTFSTVWIVKNKGANWPAGSVNLVYMDGSITQLVDGRDISPLSPYEISGGDTVTLPRIAMEAPSSPGVYSTRWSLQIDRTPFCVMDLTIIVKNP